MSTTLAVHVENACKSYGSKEVLKSLSMQVPRGSIYGLLGASGCGKTTLLSCIVGRRRLNSGDIWVLGAKPGTKGSGVPGPQAGYMPQDIALVGAFTVKDAIYYFGRIFDMPEDLIEERFVKLCTLLDLPPKNRLIRNCSGGQQRRISFAASMVHMPEILILDEPTVGVDPILRERIWDYLVEITQKSNMAVIITTHYIEEARQANVIGLMRDGRLLAEESPASLLQMFQTEFLEEAFLILSQKQNEGTLEEIRLRHTTSTSPIQDSNTDVSVTSFDTTRGSTDVLARKERSKPAPTPFDYNLNGKRIKALLDKNWKQFYRNISGVFFTLLFPIVQNIVFLLAVGPDPRNINLAIVNEETLTTSCPNFVMNGTAIPYSFSSCHYSNMSCRFLTYLDDPMIHKVKYDSLSEAKESIKHGNSVGVLFMAKNFTESFEERVEKGKDVDDDIVEFGEFKVWLDMSNRQVGYVLKYKLLNLYQDFQKDIFRDCNLTSSLVDYMHLETFYGKKDDSFTAFMTPGLVLTIMFFMMVIMTSQIIITDRSEGLWDRSVIAGVSSLEICLTHFILQTGIVIVYTVEVLIITFVLFKIEYTGSMGILVILTFLQGLAGLSYGFWISIVSYNTTMANIIATGSFYIMILLCGLMWPIEGMPLFLQYISKCLPFTIAIDSFRNVMKKGWSLNNFQVWNGIGIEILWIIFLGVVNTVLIKSKK